MNQEKKTIELSIIERLVAIPSLFPQEANRVEYMHKSNIEKKIAIPSDEAAAINLKTSENGGMTWNHTAEKPTTVEFTHLEIDFLQDQANKIIKMMEEDETKRIPVYILDFCYKKILA